MECDILRKPICVCDSDHKSPPSLSISLINFPKHVSSFKIPEIPCCCCICKPLQDDSKKSDIHDLGFALRKLEVMKCQIKKWRDEKLQLESEIRALKHALQSRGKSILCRWKNLFKISICILIIIQITKIISERQLIKFKTIYL